MPTPSNNAPHPSRSPRSFSFSTCPEGDDNEQHMLNQEEESRPLSEHLSSLVTPSFQLRHGLQTTQLREGWRPHSSSSYVASSVDEEQSSRSATFSPILSSVAAATSTIVGSSQRQTDSRSTPEGMMTSDDDEDEQKEADIVDPMLGITSSSQSGDTVHADPSELEAHRIGQQTARGQLILSLAEAEGPERGGLAGLLDRSVTWRRPDRPGQITTTGEEARPDYLLNHNSGSAPLERETSQPEWMDDRDMPGLDHTYCRVIPVSPSPYLRPGSRFHGTQQSERQRYDVQVEVKHVDLRESFLCGYLRIQGLTEDHPTLTTYFEGEIIGTKYGFTTQHPSWGASDKTDMSHWGKFQAFRPIHKQMKKTGSRNVVIHDVANCENIFMRWKEHFLVPDHRVRTIHGASFEGFYYICFNQVRGEVSGIYFHSKSEKFQQLELKHVEDKGCYAAVEFR